MSGLIIYHVLPRVAGPVRGYSGLESPGGESGLLNKVQDLGFNAIWFSPLQQTTDVSKTGHDGKRLSGSNYATRDHFNLDADISTGNARRDREHFLHFNRQAAEKGVRVFADLVFNHVAADHPLVIEENKAIDAILRETGGAFEIKHGHKGKAIGLSYEEGGEKKQFLFKFRRNDDLSLLVGGPANDPWSDVAQVNYASPEGRRFFVEGDENHKGYFKQVIDWHLDRGFNAMRLDAAYMVPPEAWKELLSYATSRQPDCVMMAETLCTDEGKVNRLAEAKIPAPDGTVRPAFDLGMLSNHWWNLVDTWLPQEENPRIQALSVYGGAGSPDNHDTQGTLAGNLRKLFNGMAEKGETIALSTDEAIARASVRDYAFSVLACPASYMQMGFEFCNERQGSVFRGVTADEHARIEKDRAGTVLDIRPQIRRINEIKNGMNVENCLVDIKEPTLLQGGQIVKIHCEYVDVGTREKKADLVLLLNRQPEHGPVHVFDHRALQGTENLVPGGSSAMVKTSVIEDVLVFRTPPAETPAAASGVRRVIAPARAAVNR